MVCGGQDLYQCDRALTAPRLLPLVISQRCHCVACPQVPFLFFISRFVTKSPRVPSVALGVQATGTERPNPHSPRGQCPPLSRRPSHQFRKPATPAVAHGHGQRAASPTPGCRPNPTRRHHPVGAAGVHRHTPRNDDGRDHPTNRRGILIGGKILTQRPAMRLTARPHRIRRVSRPDPSDTCAASRSDP